MPVVIRLTIFLRQKNVTAVNNQNLTQLRECKVKTKKRKKKGLYVENLQISAGFWGGDQKEKITAEWADTHEHPRVFEWRQKKVFTTGVHKFPLVWQLGVSIHEDNLVIVFRDIMVTGRNNRTKVLKTGQSHLKWNVYGKPSYKY